jgi:hypothetical protein
MQSISEQEKIKDHIERLEVLADIYHDLATNKYSSRSEKDVAKLKMELVKKEMLLVTYLINKEADMING